MKTKMEANNDNPNCSCNPCLCGENCSCGTSN